MASRAGRMESMLKSVQTLLAAVLVLSSTVSVLAQQFDEETVRC